MSDRQMTSKKDTADHYRVLQLPHDCTQREISASYKRLALLHHPDKTGGDKSVSNHFKQIQEAAEVLRDSKCRRLYDQKFGLQPTSMFHGYREPHELYDIPRNRNVSETPEQEKYMPWDSKPPPEEYMYTWGSSVHMNPDSDWAQAEIARHAKEMTEWETIYAEIALEGQKAENECPSTKFNKAQASPEGEAVISENAGEDVGPGPSWWKQTEEANEDEWRHGHIDLEVQKSNERLYAYGMKGGVPSDDEDSLANEASGDECDIWWENHGDGDGIWKTKHRNYLYEVESKVGSNYHSATSDAGPLIVLSDDEGEFEASPNVSKENEAGTADNSKPITNKDDPFKDTEMANVIAADEQDVDSTTGSIGCFTDLSDDEQHYVAIKRKSDVLG